MSICTKRGDLGITDGLFGTKVSKTSNTVELLGNIDELNAWIGYSAVQCKLALGVWNAMADKELVNKLSVTAIQEKLVNIMGLISAVGLDSDKDDDSWSRKQDNLDVNNSIERYKNTFNVDINDNYVDDITSVIHELEKIIGSKFKDWATPSTSWDVATRVCRRAERSMWKYIEEHRLNKHTVVYKDNDDNKTRTAHNLKPVKEMMVIAVFLNRLSDMLWLLARLETSRSDK